MLGFSKNSGNADMLRFSQADFFVSNPAALDCCFVRFSGFFVSFSILGTYILNIQRSTYASNLTKRSLELSLESAAL